ncbi:MAG: FCD domain-containing protein [Rhodospirillales bacterium]|nr:MAG: FCD domain-containing protein [Rhodospirillales bacterium]
MPLDEHKPFHASSVQSLTVLVQREVERRILTGALPAGERLSESALAADMGVSRGPVREAMRGLEQAGLVDIIANKGVVIREIGYDEAVDLYDLRGTLFGFMCETMARRRTDAQCAVLRNKLNAMAAAIRADDTDLYYRLNIQFHAAIVEQCGNSRARAIYDGIVKEMHLFRRRGLSRIENMEASMREHAAIAEAIISGRAEAARKAGVVHLRNGRDRFLATLDPAPESLSTPDQGSADRSTAAAE